MALSRWLSNLSVGSPSVRSQILSDPYYRLQSLEEVAIAVSLGVKIDVNRASVDDWLRLPGLSIHQARLLAQLSQAGVPFHCLEDVAAAIGSPVQRLKPLEPILSFCYYDPESVQTVQTYNPNTATVEMLVQIPVVDLHLARAIVQQRSSLPYRNLAHLQSRLALPPQVTAELLHYLKF
ncbi:MAG TPA: ComEA family DNA-binding protein [Thermosynechococcaceae cyanobacterium]